MIVSDKLIITGLKDHYQTNYYNECVVDSLCRYCLCSPCKTAGIGDMGPEAVYCFHMEPTCVSHLPQDFSSFF